MNKTNRVVITGLGIISAAGTGVISYSNCLKAGKSVLGLLEDPRLSLSNAKIAGIVSTCMGEHSSRHLRFAEIVASHAMEQSDLNLKGIRLGVSFGTAIAATVEMEKCFLKTRTTASENFRFGTATDAIANLFGANGPRFTVTTGCVAGLDAVGIGYDQIRLGKADAMITGATEATISPIAIAAFDRVGALSKRNLPQGSSQPFDSQRDGFVLGEGGAALVLERLDLAEKRGAVPLAEIFGWDSISSAFHMTSMRTCGEDLIKLLRQVLRNSASCTDDIDLIDVHGTSTRINDLAEANAIMSVFGNRGAQIPISAQKSIIGHLLGASNAVELVGICCMIKGSFVAPVANLVDVDSSFKIRPIVSLLENYKTRKAVKLSSGFSGVHTAMVLGKSL